MGHSSGSSEEEEQPVKKARTARLATRMKPASPPKTGRRGAQKYVEVDSTSGSDEGGSMFVDDD